MCDNINSSTEQRQYSGGGNNSSNNSNVVSRKKNNSVGVGNDLTASPKYNKSNVRGFNRDVQQQKQFRANNGNREQRTSVHAKYRNHESNNSQRNNQNNNPDFVGVDDENFDENADDSYDFSEDYGGKRSGTSGKKANINHLLNFHYIDKQRGNRGISSSNYYTNNKWSSNRKSSCRQSFSKEQFLQANCQFIVQQGSIDYSLHAADPDLAIDWSRVEQVRLHSTQPMKCPICLSEPQAGKITRCGHVYCWSCLLHYLALSDKPWRKCPVCSESIYKKDIRSVRAVVSRSIRPGDWITFRLMCRERGSVVFYPKKNFNINEMKPEPEQLSTEANKQQYRHILSATDQIILSEIIEKEKLELLKQLEEDGDQPEACFIRQALEENNEREKLVQEHILMKSDVETNSKEKKNHEDQLLPIKPVIVYQDAFDDIIRSAEDVNIQSTTNEKLNEDLRSSTEKTCSRSISNSQTPNRYYFYKADDVYHGYLNGFNTRILLHEYVSYEQCPEEFYVRVEAVESYFMTEEIRSQFRSLSHLPLTCEFQVIEIRIHPPLVSPATMQNFHEEIHRRRQVRTRKERLEKRRQKQAELVENQKLFSQFPPEMMYIPQESFPVDAVNSMEEFPAMISSVTASSSPPSASIQLFDDNLSPPSNVSFAQMLKQQPPTVIKSTVATNRNQEKSSIKDISMKTDKNNKKKTNNNSDVNECLDEDEEYYATVPNFRSSFSLEEVFDRLKLANGEEHPVSAANETTGNAATSKKKNKKNKQILFATGFGAQAKL